MMSVLRQCEWKGTDASDSAKGELTGVEVPWERIYKAKEPWSSLGISVSVMEGRQKGQRPLQAYHNRKHFIFMRQ